MSLVATVAQTVSDRTNPVVVKELRQAVQSRLVIAILLLFLLANVLVIGGYVTSNVDATTNPNSGRILFSILFAMLVATSMAFVPLYASVRLTMERNDSNIDLLFITTISPSAIIRGKFGAALALTALIYSTCLPFLTLTYLLRGIDLPSIFFALAMAFGATALVIMLGIFAGSIAGGWFIRLFLGGGLLIIGAYMMMGTIIGGMAIVEQGLWAMFMGPRGEGWAVVGTVTLVGAMAWGLLYLLAVAGVSARSSNRLFPVRVYVTACWLVLGAVLGTWAWAIRSQEPFIAWVITSVALLSIGLPFTLAERESWTPRVQRCIPQLEIGRLVAWFFFTGSAGGVLWCSLLAAATLVAGFLTPSSSLRNSLEELGIMFGLLLFSWNYSMTGLLLRRLIVPKSPPLVGTAIALLLFALGCTLPIVFAFMIRGPNWQFGSLPLVLELPHPFVLSREGTDQAVTYFFLACWAIFGLVVNLPWFLRQWQDFQRYEPKSDLSDAAPADEPAVVHA